MNNRIVKIGAAVATVATVVVAWAYAAAAQTPAAPDPGTEAVSLFNLSWPVVLDTVKDLAPYVIGAGLVLTFLRRLGNKFSKGRSPGL